MAQQPGPHLIKFNRPVAVMKVLDTFDGMDCASGVMWVAMNANKYVETLFVLDGVETRLDMSSFTSPQLSAMVFVHAAPSPPDQPRSACKLLQTFFVTVLPPLTPEQQKTFKCPYNEGYLQPKK